MHRILIEKKKLNVCILYYIYIIYFLNFVRRKEYFNLINNDVYEFNFLVL